WIQGCWLPWFRHSAQSSSTTQPAATQPSTAEAPEVREWCRNVSKRIQPYHWGIDPCGNIPWKKGGESVRGRPLVYAEFGNPASTNTTLILTMVHADEITPLYLGIQMAHWLVDHPGELKDAHVVVAPLV